LSKDVPDQIGKVMLDRAKAKNYEALPMTRGGQYPTSMQNSKPDFTVLGEDQFFLKSCGLYFSPKHSNQLKKGNLFICNLVKSFHSL
jgi:hypothetical protein